MKWEVKTLEEITDLITCGVAKRPEYVDEGIPFLSAKNVKQGKIIWEDYKFISQEIHEQLTKNNKPQKGDILYTRVGSFGEAAIIEEEYDFSIFVSLTLIKPKPIVLNSFLKYYLNSDKVKNFAKNNVSGSGVGNLNVGTVRKFLIPVPPIAEQKQIVEILDQSFAGIERAEAIARQNLTNARELFDSYLNKIFQNPPEDWTEKSLGEVCKFQGGSQPPKSEFVSSVREGYIRLIQIRDYKTDEKQAFIPIEKAKRFCKKDDIMIGRYGPPLFQILRGLDGAYNVALMKAIPNEKIISRDYLFYFLKNRSILRYIENSSSRTAGQTGFNKATIEPYPIVFPPLEQQPKIVQRLTNILENSQKLEEIYQRKIKALGELKQSILQKAFSGQLTQ